LDESIAKPPLVFYPLGEPILGISGYS